MNKMYCFYASGNKVCKMAVDKVGKIFEYDHKNAVKDIKYKEHIPLNICLCTGTKQEGF